MNKLSCNGVEEFEMFYSNFNETINNLLKQKSIAATDNIFLRSLIFHKIDIPDLASHVSQLILAPEKKAIKDIMKDILKEAKALVIGTGNKSASRVCKAALKTSTSKKTEKSVSFEVPPFPPNEHNVFPPSVYSQIRGWYRIAAKPVKD